MKKEFLQYELEVELVELGFNEKTFDVHSDIITSGFKIVKKPTPRILYQQAFKWFRQEHGLYSHVRESYAFDNTLEFVAQINGSYVNHGIEDKPINRFETYEEAELECLKKLIELCKKH